IRRIPARASPSLCRSPRRNPSMIDLLLIDDDTELTELLGGFLRERGYSLRVANNGADGLKQFFADEPNLVVLDVSMPERSGWFVLKRIRELSSVPVI